MLRNEIKVGDYILVTEATSTGRGTGIVGKILPVCFVEENYSGPLPFKVAISSGSDRWVNGVPVTNLLKALV